MTNRIHETISFGLSILLLSTVALGVAGCAKNNKAASGGPTSTVLRVSMIPSTDPGKIIRESQPFVLDRQSVE